MLIIWKEVSWSIFQPQQYSAVCMDTCVIYKCSRVYVDPVLHLWLKFQRNAKQTYDYPGCSLSYVSSRYIAILLSTLNIFYCSKRQKDKTQVKQLRQSSPITYISKYTIEHNDI